jgi:hypothetical protein
MFRSRFIIPIIGVTALFMSCRKDDLTNKECINFREGIQANDKQRVTKALAHLLTSHSRKNLDKLASSLASECNMTARVLCFGCIDTYPSQSEIRISFTESGVDVSKVLDISNNSKNKMIVVGIHG